MLSTVRAMSTSDGKDRETCRSRKETKADARRALLPRLSDDRLTATPLGDWIPEKTMIKLSKAASREPRMSWRSPGGFVSPKPKGVLLNYSCTRCLSALSIQTPSHPPGNDCRNSVAQRRIAAVGCARREKEKMQQGEQNSILCISTAAPLSVICDGSCWK